MALSDVFASNILVRWLRGNPGRYDLLTRMVGPRLGDRLLTVGAGDPGLATAVAKITGLSGRAVALAISGEEAARLTAASGRDGVLLDVVESPPGPLPFEDGDFDLALIDVATTDIDAVLPEIRRVLRPGGRVVLVVRQKAPGAPPAARVQQATGTTFRGARVLFERDGYAIVEALKGQPAPSSPQA